MTGVWREPSDPPATARPRFTAYPFTLGVASGSATSTGIVLWTRLAPEPLSGGGAGTEPVLVRWEVADDEAFAQVRARGEVDALPASAHSVHVEVDGLSPGRWYFYRFHAGNDTSPVGRTRTAPDREAGAGRLRFGLGSCQQYEQGYFAAHRHLRDENLDLMVFVGDYTYESSWGDDLVRRHTGGEPRTLTDYRNRHAQYKTDRDLQRLHAAVPWLVTWDDHEVDNDYADWRSEDLDPRFTARRSAAYQAYFEHMPLRESARPRGVDMRLYARTDWGSLATFHLLDGRQYRSPQACPRRGRGGANRVTRTCRALWDADRTMLSSAQESWLASGLRGAADRWNILAEATLVAPAGVGEGNQRRFWTDSWDGYAPARGRLFDAIRDARARSCLMVSGDAHTHYVSDLRRSPEREGGGEDDGAGEIVATEFCGSGITSQGRPQEQTDEIRDANPHIHLADSRRRGYVVIDVDAERALARLRVLDDVRDRATGVQTLAEFTVAAGQPGAQRVP